MEKYVRDSYTEHVQILSQSSLNGYKRLFGGRLMEWIDVVAGVVARRHSNRNVTTAAVDNLRFEGPAYGNETIVLCGYITYTGRTSMEVCVRTYVEELNGHKRLINVAYLVMVALDENERPVEVPRLVLATEEERREWEAAVERTRRRKRESTDKKRSCCNEQQLLFHARKAWKNARSSALASASKKPRYSSGRWL